MDKKTKILATLGPASDTIEKIEGLIKAGANMFRLNFSHGSHEYHLNTLKNIRQAMENLDKKPNFMTVPAAIRELDKMEMIRQTDGRYRLDHAVTATQKTILKAFGMDADVIRKSADELSTMLMNYDNELTGED